VAISRPTSSHFFGIGQKMVKALLAGDKEVEKTPPE
jgi:hypothetical protein